MVAGQASGAFILSPGESKVDHSEWTEVSTSSSSLLLLFPCLKTMLKMSKCLAYVYLLHKVPSSFKPSQLCDCVQVQLVL